MKCDLIAMVTPNSNKRPLDQHTIMKSENSELTLAIIKPDAVDQTEEIKEVIVSEGINIWQERKFVLSEREALELYSEHQNESYFDEMLEYMTGGPITALILSGDGVIDAWNSLIGPTNVTQAKAEQPNSLRAKYGTSGFRNAVHGSRDPVTARKELSIIFPEVAVETVDGEEAKKYLEENVNPMLLKGLTELCRTKPQDPIVWLADWLLINNSNNKSDEIESVDD